MDKKPKKKALKLERIPVLERPPDKRIADFREVPFGYTINQAR